MILALSTSYLAMSSSYLAHSQIISSLYLTLYNTCAALLSPYLVMPSAQPLFIHLQPLSSHIQPCFRPSIPFIVWDWLLNMGMLIKVSHKHKILVNLAQFMSVRPTETVKFA